MKNNENLKKLIREAYTKNKLKTSLKEAIKKLFEKDKEFMEEVKSVMMDNNQPAVEPTTKPVTVPTTPKPDRPDPRGVPNPGIDTRPKAHNSTLDLKKKINEDIMKFPDDEHERPHPETQKKLSHKTDQNATPYSDIKLFQKGDVEHSTQERIASKEFEELLKKSNEVGRLSPREIGEILMKITIIEKNHKDKLQKLAKKIIQKELGLSQDVMDNITATLLTQEMSPNGMKSVITDFDINPETGKPFSHEDEDDNEEGGNGGDNFNYPNVEEDDESPLKKLGLTKEEVNDLVGEVQVRKIMNSMIMGGGYKLFDVLKDFKTELDAIDRRLYPSYIVLNPNANLMHWMMPSTNIGGRMAAGSVKLKLEEPEKTEEQPGQKNRQKPEENKEQEKKKEIPRISKVEAKATNFAVLLHELAKGALEYLFAIRLAGFSKNLRRAITNVADDYEAEHFHKLLGPQIWKQFFYGIEIALEQYCEKNELHGLESKRDMLPLIINKISTMKTQDFIDLVDDLLNPGEAENNRRQPPLERIKAIIDVINTDIKDFMDEQDGKGGELNFGQPNNNIDHAIEQNKNNWIDDLEHKANINEPEENSIENKNIHDKNYESMNKIELTNELVQALEDEDYKLAAKIRDILQKD